MRNATVKTKTKKNDEAAKVVAGLHKVTDRYVRKISLEGFVPKGVKAKDKAKQIKKTYQQYNIGKRKLIEQLERHIKTA